MGRTGKSKIYLLQKHYCLHFTRYTFVCGRHRCLTNICSTQIVKTGHKLDTNTMIDCSKDYLYLTIDQDQGYERTKKKKTDTTID